MISFDLLGAITLTANAAVVMGAVTASYPGSQAARLRLGVALIGWFGVIVTLAAVGVFSHRRGIGTPAIGLAVLLPVLTLAYVGRRDPARSAILAIPLAALVGVNFVRVFGAFFLVLHATGRLERNSLGLNRPGLPSEV